ncbi:MAG: TonB-dependent receptor plug [Gemmatimonadetes bacterium]|nr:TonB-dependent receptor plug [Gemmatimonadota bacterium]
MRLLHIALGVVAAAPLAAQLPARAPSAALTGVVFDSTALAPLAGAVVQAVMVGPEAASTGARAFSVQADANGRFHFDSLPKGRFAFGFQHDALNVFGLESPVAGVEWTGEKNIALNLILPSSSETRAQLCVVNGSVSNAGVLGGYATDGRTGAVPAGTRVTIRWFELGLSKGKLTSLPHEIGSMVSAEGRYLVCDVPVGAPVELTVTSPGYRDVSDEVAIEAERIVVRHDFRLVSASLNHGHASITGKAATKDGALVPGGVVAIRSLQCEVPIEKGEFVFSNIPGGTWTLDIRALGFEPQSLTMTAPDSVDTVFRVEMQRRAQTLDAVTVVGRASREVKILDAVRTRIKANHGTYFGPGNDYLEHALFPADVARAAAGFRYVGYDRVVARGCEHTTSMSGVRKGVVIYVDGLRQIGGLEEAANMIPMKQVLAMEAYADVLNAPPEWRTYDACAVIAIWTKPLY